MNPGFREKLLNPGYALKIDPKIRQTLENIPELKQPFNPIYTREAMQR